MSKRIAILQKGLLAKSLVSQCLRRNSRVYVSKHFMKMNECLKTDKMVNIKPEKVFKDNPLLLNF